MQTSSRNLGGWGLLLSALAFVVLLFLGVRFRSHLVWKYSIWKDPAAVSRPTPDRPLSSREIPQDWGIHPAGPIVIRLPPDLVRRAAVGNLTRFTGKEIDEVINASDSTSETDEILDPWLVFIPSVFALPAYPL
ncbi:hypothetical protein [Planctomicrobium sp. SH664]|uniref:hypothetical protein n=1 Tax=Planctomicrobium sp. SH664 TaxID=3448125 RepID=UPI003F5B98E5